MGKIKFEVGKNTLIQKKVSMNSAQREHISQFILEKTDIISKGKANIEKTVVVKQRTYQFRANLSKDNVLGDFTWDFQVLADTQSEAEKILENYLSEPAQTGLKYKKCVGIKPLGSEEILILQN